MPVAPTKTQAAKTYVRQVTIAHADERISFVEDFLEDGGNVLHGHAAIKAYPAVAVDDSPPGRHAGPCMCHWTLPPQPGQR